MRPRSWACSACIITAVTSLAPPSPTGKSVARAVPVTWLVTAAWDFACATMLSVFAYGSTFSRLWQGVASTVIGPAALTMGARGVAAGLGLHLMVALVWSAVFVLAVARWRALRHAIARPGAAIAAACIYGPIIWLVMSLVVIPLATQRPPRIGSAGGYRSSRTLPS